MSKETTDLINQLADKLGTTAEHLWGVLVKQAPISSAVELALLLAGILGAVVLGMVAYKKSKKEDSSDHDDLVCVYCAVASAILGLIVLVVLLCESENIVAGFFNPEYWALHQLIPSK